MMHLFQVFLFFATILWVRIAMVGTLGYLGLQICAFSCNDHGVLRFVRKATEIPWESDDN
jgi:hypothetical protein